MFASDRPDVGHLDTLSRPSRHRLILACVASLLVLLMAACGGREPGAISDVETTNGYSLTLRSEGELWYDVTQSEDAGETWETKSPERYLPGTALGIAAAENGHAGRITPATSTDPADSQSTDQEILDPLYLRTTEICTLDGTTCWRAVAPPETAETNGDDTDPSGEPSETDETDEADETSWVGIERSNNGGTTWATDFRVPEGRERFAPENYPTVVDMARINLRGEETVVAVTAEHGILRSSAPGVWDRADVLHWTAPDLKGSWSLAWPELTAIAIAAALLLATLFVVMHALTRRAQKWTIANRSCRLSARSLLRQWPITRCYQSSTGPTARLSIAPMRSPMHKAPQPFGR